jgi:cytochrome oxidase Cu insertion factor (SCO1/SenC/PrrC family)
MPRPRTLWIVAAVAALVAGALIWVVPRVQAPSGTLVVVAAGRTAGSLDATTLMLRTSAGAWATVGSVSGAVPAAPQERGLLTVSIQAGTYNAVRLGADIENGTVTITPGQVEPLLIGIDSGHLIPGGVYAGNNEVNLGLGELSGKFVPMPKFDLVDQTGLAVNLSSIGGKDVVIAAFHTTCHETCPLYTALFMQLSKRLPSSAMLLEVTTDPGTDTPFVMKDYATQIGANWTFATGTSDQLAAFWKPFGVELSNGDTHTSTLALLDRHGYVRLIHRGVPKVGNDISPSLVTSLNAQGLKNLASGGDGWGTAQVLQELLVIAGPEQPAASAGGRAPAFTLATTDGGKLSLADLAGKPTVINFWATYCPPCKAEMPLLQQGVGAQPGVRLVLINEGDGAQAARAFLTAAGIRQPSLLDADLAAGKAYGVTALPVTVFVKPDGTIVARHIGQLDERVLAAELSILTSQ